MSLVDRNGRPSELAVLAGRNVEKPGLTAPRYRLAGGGYGMDIFWVFINPIWLPRCIA